MAKNNIMSPNTIKVCLVVLSGLPAAGKSSFVHKFKTYIESDRMINVPDCQHGKTISTSASEDLVNAHVVHVCYDDLMPAELEAELVADDNNASGSKSSGWKTYRKSILQCTEDVILKSLLSSSVHTTRDDEAVGEKENGATESMSRKSQSTSIEGIKVSQNVSPQASLELSSEVLQNIPPAMTQELPLEVSQNVQPQPSQELPLEVLQNTLRELSQIVPAAVSLSQNIPPELKRNVAPEVSQDIPPELSARFCVLSHSVSEFSSGCISSNRHSSSPLFIVVFDDNMYYTSMRYEVFKLARKYGTGYIQLYFPIDLTVACKRNSLRNIDGCRRVTQQVIEAMCDKMEQPRPSYNSWEVDTIEIKNSQEEQFAEVLSRIRDAVNNPPQMTTEGFPDPATTEESRAACLASLVHRADTILRKLVGLRVAAFRDTGSKSDLSLYARELNVRRTEILRDLRTGKQIIPSSEVERPSVAIEEQDQLTSYLNELLSNS